MAPPKIKICGIRTPDAMTAALESGVDFVGLVFVETSPRYVDIEVATYLAHYVPDNVQIVGLFKDPSPETLKQTLDNVRIDMIQLHGAETPEECPKIRSLYGRPVMKALSVQSSQDLKQIPLYAQVCDWVLLDAPGGGTGTAFNWDLLRGIDMPDNWMLAGGLNAGNVQDAIRLLHPNAVDVSSGVEIVHGEKSPEKIRAFAAQIKDMKI